MHAHLAALTPVGRAPEKYVAHGVLNIRDMGGKTDLLLPLRAAIRTGARVGPEIVLAGPTLNSEQHADFHRKVATAAEARAAVRELKAAGVDFIKIHRATNREAFDAIADETKRQDMAFAGHVPLVMGWIEASNAGMRSIEHIQTIFENIQPDPTLVPAQFDTIANRLNSSLGDSIFAAMKANRTFFDLTLVGYEASIRNATPAVAERRRVAYEKMKVIAARAARAGVPIITGTDVLERHGEMLLLELERLVEIGLTPQQVLAAATLTSAEAAQRPELGRVMVGAPASFIILDGNPLLDIKNLRAISAVVLRKEVLEANELAKLGQ
jgi:imidazolonepropionase-like amidohydrolase